MREIDASTVLAVIEHYRLSVRPIQHRDPATGALELSWFVQKTTGPSEGEGAGGATIQEALCRLIDDFGVEEPA